MQDLKDARKRQTPANHHPLLLKSPALVLLIACLLLAACGSRELPVLGKPKQVNGQMVPHTIPDFAFINQDSQLVTNATFAGKCYVADFFFISCPTICPVLTEKMQDIYRRFANEDRLLLLSHTIDPVRDTVGRLQQYAENLGISSEKWHFVTGDQDSLFAIADDYYSIAYKDPDAPGGFDHTGRLILVDENRQIRSYCNAANEAEYQRFLKDIAILLHEE